MKKINKSNKNATENKNKVKLNVSVENAHLKINQQRNRMIYKTFFSFF